MKANRRFVNGKSGDDAVSPVIAVILMVAITVVLAATVYLWVSGFGSNQQKLVQASFAAKAVDIPITGFDADTSDDGIEIIYTSGTENLAPLDVEIFVDGNKLVWQPTTAPANRYHDGAIADQDVCSIFNTTNGGPSGSTTQWARGSSLYLMESNGANACAAGNRGDFTGLHTVRVLVRGQVVLDTSVEVHDNAGS